MVSVRVWMCMFSTGLGYPVYMYALVILVRVVYVQPWYSSYVVKGIDSLDNI